MKGSIQRPRALVPGDRIAVVAPSGPFIPEELAQGIEILRHRGFLIDPPVLRKTRGIFAASDDERFADLWRAAIEPGVRAIWIARGGYGLTRILHRLDPVGLREEPKLLIGFSDATALLAFWVQRAGLVGIHGPMVAHDLGREADQGGLDHVLEIAAGRSDWRVPIPTTLAAGSAEAPVAGGCLSVLASLAGTPDAVSFRGRVALLEDHYEKPRRRIDRLLTQLRRSGSFDGVRAIFFGVMHECGPTQELHETIMECVGDLGVPIGFGAPVGHGPSHLAVPFGVAAKLELAEGGNGWLSGLDAAVV